MSEKIFMLKYPTLQQLMVKKAKICDPFIAWK